MSFYRLPRQHHKHMRASNLPERRNEGSGGRLPAGAKLVATGRRGVLRIMLHAIFKKCCISATAYGVDAGFERRCRISRNRPATP
jgi:hypothetical protein